MLYRQGILTIFRSMPPFFGGDRCTTKKEDVTGAAPHAARPSEPKYYHRAAGALVSRGNANAARLLVATLTYAEASERP